MTQDLAVEVLSDPSHGFTGMPARRSTTRPTELQVKLYAYSRDQLAILAQHGPGPWHQAVLDVSAEDLRDRADRLRSIWRDQVVRQQSTTPEHGRRVGGYPLAESADLTELRTLTEPLVAKLADEGYDLLDVMLTGTDYNLVRFREFFLTTLASSHPLRVSFDSDELQLPWPMLAVDPAMCPTPWEAFLGHRHQVEQATAAYSWDQAPLGHREQATTSLNKDTALDHVGRAHEVHDLLDQRSQLVVRTRGSDLIDALSHSVLHEDIMYFWCHGYFVSTGASSHCLSISLSDGEHIDGPVVSRKRRRYVRTPQARFKPFVLLNACNTAQSASPGKLKHLGQELIAMGADGVLAPQIEIPQLFATEYAYAFLEHYLTGDRTAGEISQLLVRRFARDFHNPLALTYSLHCGMNSRLDLAS
jgi:hypothetical protein